MFFQPGYSTRRPSPQVFSMQYQCYSMAMIGKSQLDFGDKILLPPSALNQLSRMEVEYPMLFELKNEFTGNKTHCGVREFSAEEGKCHLPYLLMQTLNLEEGSILTVKNVSLPKCTFLKVRAQSCDFLEIKNPRAVLEVTLRDYTCVTVGDTLKLSHLNGQTYYVDVQEVRPDGRASIVETDVIIDFDEPVGYQQSKYAARERANSVSSVASDAKSAADSDVASMASTPTPRELQKAGPEEATPKSEPSFVPFAGVGRRIDGRPTSAATTSGSPASSIGTGAGIAAGASITPRPSSAVATPSAATPGSASSGLPPTSTVPSFQSRIGDKYSKKKNAATAFSGKGHSLT